MICDGMYFIAFLDTEFYLINAKVTEKSASCSEIIRHWVISELNECLYRALQLWKTNINSLPTFAQHEVYLSLI